MPSFALGRSRWPHCVRSDRSGGDRPCRCKQAGPTLIYKVGSRNRSFFKPAAMKFTARSDIAL